MSNKISVDKNTVQSTLEQMSYKIEVVKKEGDLYVKFPSNKILLQKINSSEIIYNIVDNQTIRIYNTAQQKLAEVKLPEYALRPVLDLDIKIASMSYGYDPEYIFYYDDDKTCESLRDLLPAPSDSKQELMEESLFALHNIMLQGGFPAAMQNILGINFKNRTKTIFDPIFQRGD